MTPFADGRIAFSRKGHVAIAIAVLFEEAALNGPIEHIRTGVLT
jgi:hypothetical protein